MAGAQRDFQVKKSTYDMEVNAKVGFTLYFFMYVQLDILKADCLNVFVVFCLESCLRIGLRVTGWLQLLSFNETSYC